MILLLVIFIIFIGMGVPHSLLGVAWPSVYESIGVPLSSVSILMMITSGCTVVSSICGMGIIKRLGENKISLACMLMMAAGILLNSFAESFLVFCITSALLGICSGFIETALNNYVSLHYKAVYMNFLHCFYAIGIAVSPLILALTIGGGKWRVGYMIISAVQMVIAVIVLSSLPLWKKQKEISTQCNESEFSASEKMPLSVLKNPQVIAGLVVIFATNVVEYACGSWGSTYLVEAKKLSAEVAASVITVCSVGMIIGRFAGSFLAFKISCIKIVAFSSVILLTAGSLLIFAAQEWMLYIAFFLLGFANGPVCPNMIYLIPKIVNPQYEGSVMGVQIAVGYIGVLLTPIIFGVITRFEVMNVYPFVVFAMIFAIIFSTAFFALNKKHLKI